MTLDDALTARIEGVPELGTMLAEEGGWSMRLVTVPGITLQTVADLRPQHMKGFPQVRQTTVQIDVWADAKSDAVRVRELLIALLIVPVRIEQVRFQRAMIAGMRSASAPEQSGERQRFRGHVVRESIDFIFTHNAN